MNNNSPILTIIGSGGGVAKAILAILNKSIKDQADPIYASMNKSKMYLIDMKQKKHEYYESNFPHLKHKLFLCQFDAQNSVLFQEHLIRTKTNIVIDVSWADTLEMLRVCNEVGVHYINTALENPTVDNNRELRGYSLLERYKIFDQNKNTFSGMTGIICSGMNPGIVQWMALELMEKTSEEKPLACYIVEQDNTFYANPSYIEKETLYTTWSPECFLDEAIYNYPMFMKNNRPHILKGDVYDHEFKVSLGSLQFHGCLMPHEEVIMLGKRFDIETGFIYKINDYTTNVIRENIHCTEELWNWKHKVLDPLEAELQGEDVVGVLLVYNDKERFIYNKMSTKEVFAEYKTNATYFQVGCGIYGALATLLLDDIPKGIFYVDDLVLNTDSRYGRYVSYYMKDFVIGEKMGTDGLLFDRRHQMISQRRLFCEEK